jgi:hypothetical protein
MGSTKGRALLKKRSLFLESGVAKDLLMVVNSDPEKSVDRFELYL